MKNIPTVNFNNKNRADKSHIRKKILIFSSLIFACGLVIFFIFLLANGFNIKKTLGVREETSTEPETTTLIEETFANTTEFTDNINFLVICDNDDKDIQFAYIISLIANENRIKIKPLDPELHIAMISGDCTFDYAYKNTDINLLKERFTDFNIPVSRYMLINKSDFISMINMLGHVNIYLDKEFVYYMDSIKNICPSGEFEFTAEGLYNYIKYNHNDIKNFEYSSEAAKRIIEEFFNEDNCLNEALFEKIINFFNTDISAFDYMNYKDILLSLCRNGFSVSINS